MKDRQFHIYLDDEEYGQVLQALIALKNNLIAQGRYTDAVDDVLSNLQKHEKKDDCAIHLNKTAVMPLVSLRRSRRLLFLGQFLRSKIFSKIFSEK